MLLKKVFGKSRPWISSAFTVTQHLKSVIEIKMKFPIKFTLQMKFSIFIESSFGCQSYLY